MKRILGSLLLFALFLKAANIDIQLNKTKAFIKEPLTLDITFKPKSKAAIVWVECDITPSKAYEFHLLHKSSQNKVYHFRYLFFGLKPGPLELPITLRIKTTSKEELQNSILGTGYEQTEEVAGEVFALHISKLLFIKPTKPVDLYGSFHLQSNLSTPKAKAYEPIYLTIHLQGKGYPPKNLKFLPNLENVKILSDKPQTKISYHPDGAHIDYYYQFALIAKESFSLPKKEFKGFDYHNYYTLTIPAYHIQIIPKKELDSLTAPKPIKPVAPQIFTILGYLAIFIAGMLSGILAYLIYQRKNPLKAKILRANKKEMLKILTLYFPNRFKNEKEALAKAIKTGENYPLKKLKKEVIYALRKNQD